MKRIIYTSMLVVLICFSGISQAILPTSWNFATTTLPNGWTESDAVGYYTASGNPAPAKKFDSTGDNLVIYFGSNPGNLTYDLTGNSFSGGTFTVEESELGAVWTPLHVHTAPPAGTYSTYTDVPLSATRYIRFNYTNKVTGNIGLDNVNIAVAAAGPAQEINVKQGSITILNGGTSYLTSPVSAMTPVTFTVENLGLTNTLNISSAVISGPNAADFSVSSVPSTVSATSTGNLVVNFTPSLAGTRSAIMTITNNDADESSYIINLYGIGGNFASEPMTQPTNLSFTNVKTYRLTGSFVPTSGAEGYLVLRKKGSAITGLPADGTVYERGDIVGDAQVVFSSNSTSFVPNNIVASTDYYFAVFAYNGIASNRNYLTTNPLTANVMTPNTMMPSNYYNGISTSSGTFVADLHALVNPHQMQFYSNYGNLMIRNFTARDTTLNRRVITCVYSGENKIYTEPFDFTANGYSREHTYCHSWMPTNPAQDLPEYNDYHHLFPTNQNEVNALRSNYPLGIVVTQTDGYQDAKFGLDANGNTVFEPRDEHKGDAARAMMYESICYTTVSGNNWGIPAIQNLSLLKQWHFQDLPSNWEIARNDYLDSLQSNRNPFVDSIDYVCFVNFANMTYEALGCLASIEELLSSAFIVYPNPAKEELTLHVDATTISSVEIVDIQGRNVLNESVENQILVKLDISNLQAGTYIVKAKTPFGIAQRSLVIE